MFILHISKNICNFASIFQKRGAKVLLFLIRTKKFLIFFKKNFMRKVLGLGNALTDMLLSVNEQELLELGLPKGSMSLVNYDTALALQNRFADRKKTMVAGGSASNTINTIARLGGKAAFIGKIGNDHVGKFYLDDMFNNGVTPVLFPSTLLSGCCTVLITPDGERTFATYLGAASDMRAEDINEDMFDGYDIFHIEGYLVQNHQLIEKAVKYASEAGLKISIDLASYNTVNGHYSFLHNLVREYVDIVFANEDESFAYTGLEPIESAEQISKECDIAVVKVGKHGSYIQRGTESVHIDAITSNCVDSTGAGDLYAGGFLFGLANDYDIERCGRIGTLAAGRVVETVGTKLSDSTWNEVRAYVNSFASRL